MPNEPSSSLKGGVARTVSAVAAALDGLPSPGMIIGCVAVILHGVPRVTRDVDGTVDGGSIGLDALSDLPFELEAIAAREDVASRSVRAHIARPEDLVIYKAIAWRPQDQQDVERLLTLHAGRMDLARIRTVVAVLAAAIDEPDRLDHLDLVIARATR